MSYTLAYIVEQLGGELRGDDLAVARLAPLEQARPDEIAFVAHAKFRRQMLASEAGALIVTEALAAELPGRPLIVAADPYLYFARLASLFHPQPQPRAGIHPRAVVGEGGSIGAGSEIAANVTIGDRVAIGERCPAWWWATTA